MHTTPLNYHDYLLTLGSSPMEEEFLLPTEFRSDGKHHAACSCRPHLMQRALVIVDCRHIPNSIVEQDWACNGCWSSWIRASGAKEHLHDLVKNTPNMGNDKTRSEVAKAGRFEDHEHPHKLQEELMKAKDAGELEMSVPKLHCFTRSEWMKMHGVGEPERYKNTKYDFIP